MDLAAAVERLHRFGQTLERDDVVDEATGLTGADLCLIVEHAVVVPRDDARSGDSYTAG